MPHSTATNLPQSPNDPILLPFLCAPNAQVAREQLDRLLRDHADPVISATARHYAPTGTTYAAGSVVDVREETICALLNRLASTSIGRAGDGELPPIRDFRAFVSTTTRHVCWKLARRTKHEAAYSSLRSDGNEPDFCMDECLVERASIGQTAICRAYLRRLWDEILLLPMAQRVALLLSIRQSNGEPGLPRFCRVVGAACEQIEAALAVTPGELAQILPLLPFDDALLADRLGLSIDAVQNLRVAARRRLNRRLKEWAD